MTDEHKQRLQEEREDAALRLLMKEYAQIEGEALWREFQAAEAAEKERDAIQRENRESGRGSGKANRRIDFLKGVGKGCRRAAVLFLVLVCLSSPFVMSTEAFKIPVINYFVAIETKFSEFNFGKTIGISEEQEALIDLIATAPWPDGYFLSTQEVTPSGKVWMDFIHEEKIVMRISILPSSGQINIDTEDIEQIPMEIHNHEAVYLQKDGHRIMWIDAERELLFNVHAYELEEEDFWKYVSELISILSE